MARLRYDLLANVGGQGWAVAINLLFVPFFLRALGVERYGLIAFVPVAVGLLQVLDAGLAITLNREMAASVGAGTTGRARTIAWTLQTLHVSIGLAVGVIVLSLAPAFAAYWLKPAAVSVDELRNAAQIMAFAIVLQWPVALFQNGLMGLGLQRRANILLGANATLVNVGAWLLFTQYDPSLRTYFFWLAVCSALHSTAAALTFWRSLPLGERPFFDRAELLRFWRFSVGAGGIGVTGVLLLFADRLLASRLLSLEQFGFYGLATTIGRSIYLLIAPISSAVFPRFSGFAGRRDWPGLTELYSTSTQLMAVAIIPPTVVLAWAGSDAALLWLGNAGTSATVAAIASLIVIGSAFNGLMNLPFALQLACGLTRLGLSINILLLVLVAPLGIVLGARFGAPGVASTWLLINLAYFAIGAPLTHRLTGIGRTASWLLQDIAPVVLFSALGMAAVASIAGEAASRWGAALNLCIALAATYIPAALAAPQVRRKIRTFLLQFQ